MITRDVIAAHGWRMSIDSTPTLRSYVVLANGWRAIYDRLSNERVLRLLAGKWSVTVRRRSC
jgi:hypothetical protein